MKIFMVDIQNDFIGHDESKCYRCDKTDCPKHPSNISNIWPNHAISRDRDVIDLTPDGDNKWGFSDAERKNITQLILEDGNLDKQEQEWWSNRNTKKDDCGSD